MMDCEEETEKTTWRCWFRTLFAASGALFLLTVIGITEAQSAVMLPQLRKADSFIHVTPDEETWIASLNVIMAPISSILAGPFIDTLGRKKGLQYFYFNMGLGFGLMACAKNVYHIYIGRIICGIGTGLEVCTVVYVSEICTKKQRNDISAMVSALFASGVTLSNVVGDYLPWTLASLIFSVICFVFFILQFFIPESPPWLFKMGKTSACSRSLQTLGRTQAQIDQELAILKLSADVDGEKVDCSTFLKPTVWKPFLILSTFFFLHSASGMYDVIYYSVDFAERLGTTYDPLAVSMLFSAARLLSTATIGIYLRWSVGRRFTVAFSALGMTLGFVGAGTYEFIFRDTAIPERPCQWVPVAFVVLHMASGVFGMLNLPWVMTGEMYPLRVRGTMTGVTLVMGFTSMFVFIKMYYTCLGIFEIHGLLFAFAVPSFVAIWFAIFVLPETKNKSLFEIEQGFWPKNDRPQTIKKNEVEKIPGGGGTEDVEFH